MTQEGRIALLCCVCGGFIHSRVGSQGVLAMSLKSSRGSNVGGAACGRSLPVLKDAQDFLQGCLDSIETCRQGVVRGSAVAGQRG